jgi:hypothetical protein
MRNFVQLVPLNASRRHLLERLYSGLTCANGCSCWSPLEGIRPRFVVVSDALWPAELHAPIRSLSATSGFVAVSAGAQQSRLMHHKDCLLLRYVTMRRWLPDGSDWSGRTLRYPTRGTVVAYFSLAAHLVVRAELPTPFRRCCSPGSRLAGPCTDEGLVASCCSTLWAEL